MVKNIIKVGLVFVIFVIAVLFVRNMFNSVKISKQYDFIYYQRDLSGVRRLGMKDALFTYDIQNNKSDLFCHLDGTIKYAAYNFKRDLLIINFHKRLTGGKGIHVSEDYIIFVKKSSGKILDRIKRSTIFSVTDDYVIYEDDNIFKVVHLDDPSGQVKELNLDTFFASNRYSFASINGSMIYVDNDRNGLYIMDNIQSEERLLLTLDTEWYDLEKLSDNEIIFRKEVSGGWQLFKFNIDNRKITQITDSEYSHYNPSVSGDGLQILFDTKLPQEGRGQKYSNNGIGVVYIDGSKERLILNTEGVTEYSPIWIH